MPNGHTFHGPVNMDSSQNAFNTGTITSSNYQSDGSTNQLLQLIDDLRNKIGQHERELDDPEGLRESTNMLQEQLQSGNAKPGRLRAILTSMTAMAGSVTAIGTAVSAVREAIGT